MKKKSPPLPPSRPTLAVVAKLAGVSLMTASYAMRNNPKISASTSERVRRAAKTIGYAPHPEIGRLMHLLRAKRLPSYQATLGMLSFSHATRAAPHRYTEDVIAGAKSRAATLGYTVDLLSVDYVALSPTRLTTMLKARGIRGVLIPPLAAMEDCSQLLDWSQFSLVAATYSAQNLSVNRVVPHHQNNVMLALAQLLKLGYRRIGLVLTGNLVRRANFAYQATLALHQQQGELATIPAITLDSDHSEQLAGVIEPWVRDHRPDAILTAENAVSVLRGLIGPRFGSEIRVCLLDHPGKGRFAGVDQHPFVIGETAVDLLAGQVQRGEIGFEKHPRVTMVEGTWLDGEHLLVPVA